MPRFPRTCNKIAPIYYPTENEVSELAEIQEDEVPNLGDRIFVSMSNQAVYCDQKFLTHSPYFSLLFEVTEGSVQIDRDFDLFRAVLKFAKYPTQRLQLLRNVADRGSFAKELDFYAMIDSCEIQAYLNILEVMEEKDDLMRSLRSSRFYGATGFLAVFRGTVARLDIPPSAIHLILRILVAQAWSYRSVMFRRMFNYRYIDKDCIEWFKNPNHVKRNDRYKVREIPPMSWLTLDIRELLITKKNIVDEVKEKFPDEKLHTSGIDSLFDCSASYPSNVDLIVSMRVVLRKITTLIEMYAIEKKESYISNIKKCLTHPTR